MYRRVIAASAAMAMALVAVPLASPASAVDACALGQICEGTATGSLGTTKWKIQMPAANFNGTVLLYSHGYRVATPVPAALAVPLGLNALPKYVPVTAPGLGASFVGSDVAEVAPSDSVANQLLAKGYALAGAGYAKQGWAVAEGVQAGELLMDHINKGGIKGVKKIAVYGESLGANISQVLAERNPRKVSGTLGLCGAYSGPVQLWSGSMTALFTWKTLINPTIRGANYQSYAQALGDLQIVLGTLNAVAAGTQTVSPLGYPIAQANMLAGLMAGLPTNSTNYDGFANPNVEKIGTAAAAAQGYTPLSAGASTAAAMLQNVGAAVALGVLGRYDLEQRARALAGIAPTDNANFNGNVAVRYSALLSEAQRNEFGDTMNAVPGVANNLDRMLNALDASIGNPALRFPENGAAVKAINSIPTPNGNSFRTPTVMVTTQSDPISPEGNQGFMNDLISSKLFAATKKGRVADGGAGRESLYTEPVPVNYTKYTANGVRPDLAASTTESGVGHCNFRLNLGNGAQVIGGMDILAAYMNKSIPAGQKKARQVVRGVGGFVNDPDYEPTPLKDVALAK